MPETDRKPRKPSWGAVAKTIFWSFFGVRRRAGHEAETVRLRPGQVIVAAVLGAAVFVIALVLLARWIVRIAAS